MLALLYSAEIIEAYSARLADGKGRLVDSRQASIIKQE